MDCSLPGSSIHGIFQARILEWGAISSPNPPELWHTVLLGRSLLWLCLAKHEAELSAQRLRDAVSSMTQRGRVQALSSSLRSPAEVFCCFEPNWVSQGEEACGSPLAAQVEGTVHRTRWRSNRGSPGHPLPPWCSGCSSTMGVGWVIIVLFIIELFCVLKQLTHVKCFEQYLKHSKHSKH